MSERERIRARIVERLAAPESPHRRALVAGVIDQAFAQRLRELVDLEEVHQLVLASLSVENVRRAVERHIAPAFERHAQVVPSSSDRVGSLVSPAARERLREVARRLRLPAARWAEGAIDPALLRRLLGPVWQQVLLNFAKRLPLPGLSGAAGPAAESARSGLRGFLSRSAQEQAERLIDRGRSVIGGLGGEVERRLTAAARDFSDAAAAVFRQALLERLASEEGRELSGQIMLGLLEHVLHTRFAELQPDLEALPVPELLAALPELVAAAAPSPFVQDIARREIAAWLAREGDRTLDQVLDELGIRAAIRAALMRRADGLAAGWFRSGGFDEWLSDLLRE